MNRVSSFIAWLACGLGAVLLAGCNTIPDPDGPPPADLEAAPYPEVIPVERILGDVPPDPEADRVLTERLDARASALQARARQLRTRQIDGDAPEAASADPAADE